MAVEIKSDKSVAQTATSDITKLPEALTGDTVTLSKMQGMLGPSKGQEVANQILKQTDKATQMIHKAAEGVVTVAEGIKRQDEALR